MFRFYVLVCLILHINWTVSYDNNSDQRVSRQNVGFARGENFTECGVSSISKIIPKRCCNNVVEANREYLKLGEFPWKVELLYRKRIPTTDNPRPRSGCGGTLIGKSWVVTAAHCVVKYNAYVTLHSVRLGDLNFNDSIPDGATPMDVLIDKVFVHPKFSLYPAINDIALLHLREPVSFNQYLHPICMKKYAKGQQASSNYDNTTAYVLGYGENLQEGELSTALQDAAIEIVDKEKCAKIYQGYQAVIDDQVLCAGGDGSDNCHGISGGPLAIPIKNQWYLIGIVSYGVECSDSRFPGVYTRIAAFSEWIANVTAVEFTTF